MTARMPGHPAITRSRPPGAHGGSAEERQPRARRQRTSPQEGQIVRPLSRCQVDDRMGELGELYARTSSCEPGILDPPELPQADVDRCVAFQRRLAGLVRCPGFELLVAESAGPSGTRVITACAFGFPLRGDGPWWQGLERYLPESLFRPAASGRLFVVADILVEHRVRTHDQSREWNLARRLQRGLLGERRGDLGVTLVDRGDADAYRALLSWGWRCLPADSRRPSRSASRRLLVLV
ncbi:hypothetical protein ABT090_18045 [Streptomyces asoensis]|uniref:hypothetical protein n=1 Tax=Streptomyces asoensis TaxID=249586 RepID=UPI003332820D